MSEKKTAEKPSWAPNEAPAGRWIGFFFAGLVAMGCAQGLFQCVKDLWTMDGAWSWLPGPDRYDAAEQHRGRAHRR